MKFSFLIMFTNFKNLIVWLRRYEQRGNRLSKYSQEIEVPVVWKNNYKLTEYNKNKRSVTVSEKFYSPENAQSRGVVCVAC